MATRVQVRNRLAGRAGYNTMSLERGMRVQGQAGLIPTGGPGRRTDEFERPDLKNVLIGMGGPQPSDAARAVEVLNNLPCSTNRLMNIGEAESPFYVAPGTTLGDAVENLLEKLLDPAQAEQLLLGMDGNPLMPPFYISMCLDEQYAIMSAPFPGSAVRHIEVFQVPNAKGVKPKHHRRTEVMIDMHVIAEASQLLADARKHQPSLIPSSAPGSAGEGDATPEKKKASGTGIHEGLLSVQPATMQAVSLDKSLSTGKRASKQSAASSRSRESQVGLLTSFDQADPPQSDPRRTRQNGRSYSPESASA